MGSSNVHEALLKAVQHGRERHSPPIVNRAVVPWPLPSPAPPGLAVEELEYFVEPGAQGWVPLRIIRPADPPAAASSSGPPSAQSSQAGAPSTGQPGGSGAGAGAGAGLGGEASGLAADAAVGAAPRHVRRPVVVFLHSTGQCLESVRHKQELFARMGYLTAAIDARYHGRRAAVPYEVTAALDAAAAAAGKAQPSALPASAAAAIGVSGGRKVAAAGLVATVKHMDSKLLSALDRADAAVGLTPGGTDVSGAATGAVTPSSPSAAAAALLTGVRAQEAAAKALRKREADERRRAQKRFTDAWVAAVAEFSARRGADATAAALATAPTVPPPPPPSLPPALAAAGNGFNAAVALALAAAASAAATDAESAIAAAKAAAGRGRRGAAAAGDVATPRNVYEMALVAAWRGSGERPFHLDTVWDLVLLLDVLCAREDVDPERIGMTGYSAGGTWAWLAAAVDPRVAVAAPVAGVQDFGWALAHESFQARVDSVPLVFEVAAADIKGAKGAKADADVVRTVWEKLMPGLLQSYDAPLSLPAIAPRPLLVVTGELDPRCPLTGVRVAVEAARPPYLKWVINERRLQREEAAEREAAAAAARAREAAEAAAAAARAEMEAALLAEAEAAAISVATAGAEEEAVVAPAEAESESGGSASEADGAAADADTTAKTAEGSAPAGDAAAAAALGPGYHGPQPADPATAAPDDAETPAGAHGIHGAEPGTSASDQVDGEAAEPRPSVRHTEGMEEADARTATLQAAAAAPSDGGEDAGAAGEPSAAARPAEPGPAEAGVEPSFGGAAGPAAAAPEPSMADGIAVEASVGASEASRGDGEAEGEHSAGEAGVEDSAASGLGSLSGGDEGVAAKGESAAAESAAADASVVAEASAAAEDPTAAPGSEPSAGATELPPADTSESTLYAEPTVAISAGEELSFAVERSAATAATNDEDDDGILWPAALASEQEFAETAAAAAATAAGAEEAVIWAAIAAADAAAAAEAATEAEAAAAAAAAMAAAKAAARQEEEVVSEMLDTRLRLVVDAGVGHTETGRMQRAVEKWLHMHLLVPWKRAQAKGHVQ